MVAVRAFVHTIGCAALLAGAAQAAAAEGGVVLSPGRTASVEVSLDVGTPVERAVPGRAYALAVGMDREQRWGEAAALYQQAITEWSAAMHLRPSRERRAGARAARAAGARRARAGGGVRIGGHRRRDPAAAVRDARGGRRHA